MELAEIGPGQAELVGGKGANLGALTRLEGCVVPEGVCVTTHAFRRALTPAIVDALERLSGADRAAAAELRAALEQVALPEELTAALRSSLDRSTAYAVRSSATSEDSPNTSFAGQHDSFLNIRGEDAVLEHLRRCWASLFTDRAIAYRTRNGIDHRKVSMAVVVQRMVEPQASGVLFTADPLSGDRRTTTVEACLGLADTLLSGSIGADVYRVRSGALVERSIAPERAATPTQQERPALTEAQVLALTELGQRIEADFGQPQDIEWCLVDGHFEIVQARPITTLFPIPPSDDGENHVYISVGHQQMMTDAMKPLGLSLWQLSTPRPMAEAGGRLFVDVSRILASPTTRGGLLETLGRSDPLLRDALQVVLDRGDFLATPSEASDWVPPSAGPDPIDADPAIVERLIARNEASVAALAREIEGVSGVALLDVIAADIPELRRILHDPESHRVIMAGMDAARWIDDHMRAWLGETNASDTLSQSVPHNVTAQMGLALMDVADAFRPHPAAVRLLEQGTDDTLLVALSQVAGADEAVAALAGWLERYGMRGIGEIDITRPRFTERPTMLAPMLLANVRNFAPGESSRRFARGASRARALEERLLARLQTLPDGDQKVAETQRRIARVRTFAGYREYPKYGLVRRYFLYKRALLREAARLAEAHVLAHPDDLFFLRFEELREVVRTNRVDPGRIAGRKAAYERHRRLSPPRVLTSDGEAITGSYGRADLPEGAMVGLAVSAGVVEGRARVILKVEEARLEPGDILVTAYTDPSWTPLFVGIAGLVTEVGGLMTHGAVIAREFGVPAVVGVQGATTRIRDGQRIRLDGASGVVEILQENLAPDVENPEGAPT